MSEPQFSYPAFRIACVAAWTELVQAMRKDGHAVNDKSGPNTRTWMENIVRDTFIAQSAGHLTPRRAAAVVLLQTMGYHWDGVAWNAPIPHPTLRDQLQQKCSDWGAYWRAPDAHGVELTPEQAYELLRRALGVEVNIAGVKEKPNFHGLPIVEDNSLPSDMVLVDAGGSAPPIAISIDGGGNKDLSIAYLLGKYDGRKAALQQGGQDECAANGFGHKFGPHGPGRSIQCEYCGEPQQPAEAVPVGWQRRYRTDGVDWSSWKDWPNEEFPKMSGRWINEYRPVYATPRPAIDIGKLRELAEQLKSMANTTREYAKRPSVSAQDVKDMLGLVRIFERLYRELCAIIGDGQ